MITFKFNENKAIELVLYLANKKSKIDKLTLLKFIFFADIYHLNKYDRPILGGKYVAMPNGPVASELFDIIKKGNSAFALNKNTILPNREGCEDYFSKSDLEALDYAFNQYSQYSGPELSDLSHEHKAWINAREREPFSNNPIIHYKDFFDDEFSSQIEFLEENAHLMVI